MLLLSSSKQPSNSCFNPNVAPPPGVCPAAPFFFFFPLRVRRFRGVASPSSAAGEKTLMCSEVLARKAGAEATFRGRW